VSFGRYDFKGGFTKTEDMPEFLAGLRARAEAFAGSAPGSFQQALVTKYAGVGIGWHRDRSVFGDVVGILLLSSCIFRLRRKNADGVLLGSRALPAFFEAPSRAEWEHIVPRIETFRYSVTFRNVLSRGAP